MLSRLIRGRLGKITCELPLLFYGCLGVLCHFRKIRIAAAGFPAVSRRVLYNAFRAHDAEQAAGTA